LKLGQDSPELVHVFANYTHGLTPDPTAKNTTVDLTVIKAPKLPHRIRAQVWSSRCDSSLCL